MTPPNPTWAQRLLRPDESLRADASRATAAPAATTTPAAPGPATTPASTPEPLARSERFEPRAPRFRLENVILPEAAGRRVRAILARAERHGTLYDTWGLRELDPSTGRLVFNLYGPPGTGKTMLAEALADRLGRRVIEVNYAEIESKYVGDTPKNISAAFKAARESGAALLFDEADSILGKRMTTVTQAADHSVNVSRAVMLKELDGFDGMVMFATNLARNFDGAFVRRILFHIEIPAPDAAARRRLWEHMVPRQIPGRAELVFADLARLSDGLVGGDIKNAILLAATEAVQREGADQRLRLDDLTAAMEAVRSAKRDVGNFDYSPSRSGFGGEGP